MNIRKRKNIEIKENQRILKSNSFGLFELKNKYRLKHNKKINSFLFQKPNILNKKFKLYKEGYVYKLMELEKFEMWKDLLKKKIPVEEIESYGNNLNKEIKEDIKKHNLTIPKDKILVKSKVIGINLKKNLMLKHAKLINIQELTKKKVINLTEGDKKSIALQITKITLKLLENNYIHNHPHTGNWAIDVSKKPPKVRLIDFDNIQKINNIHEIKNVARELNTIANVMSIIFNENKEKINKNKFYDLARKKFENYLKEKIKK